MVERGNFVLLCGLLSLCLSLGGVLEVNLPPSSDECFLSDFESPEDARGGEAKNQGPAGSFVMNSAENYRGESENEACAQAYLSEFTKEAKEGKDEGENDKEEKSFIKTSEGGEAGKAGAKAEKTSVAEQSTDEGTKEDAPDSAKKKVTKKKVSKSGDTQQSYHVSAEVNGLNITDEGYAESAAKDVGDIVRGVLGSSGNDTESKGSPRETNADDNADTDASAFPESEFEQPPPQQPPLLDAVQAEALEFFLTFGLVFLVWHMLHIRDLDIRLCVWLAIGKVMTILIPALLGSRVLQLMGKITKKSFGLTGKSAIIVTACLHFAGVLILFLVVEIAIGMLSDSVGSGSGLGGRRSSSRPRASANGEGEEERLSVHVRTTVHEEEHPRRSHIGSTKIGEDIDRGVHMDVRDEEIDAVENGHAPPRWWSMRARNSQGSGLSEEESQQCNLIFWTGCGGRLLGFACINSGL